MDSQQILKAVNANRQGDLDISDMSREMIERLYEESLVDRYIVKYKDGATSRSVEDVTSFTVAKTYSIDAEQVISATGRKSRTVMDRSTSGRLEVVVLSEKVNPAEFAAELKAAGMASKIAFIQPDYILSFAGLTLDYDNVKSGG